jgi:hypothetical protein
MQNKVFLNVNDSDIFYRYQNFKFYFSSKATRERFIRKLEIYIKDETNKFINKYNCSIDLITWYHMFAFILYNKTEKRGFKVEQYQDNLKIRDIKEIPTFLIWR